VDVRQKPNVEDSGTQRTQSKLTDEPSEEIGVASDEQLRLLIDGATEHAIIMVSPEGSVLTWNDGARRMKGYSASEVAGKHFSLFYPAAEVQSGKPLSDLETAAREGMYSEQGWRVRKDGSLLWASVTITALRDSTGNLRGFGEVTRDLTERLQSVEEVAKLHDDQERILETLGEGIVLYDVNVDGKACFQRANSMASQLLGVDLPSLKAMAGRSMPQLDICDALGKPMSRSDLPYAVTARTGQPIHDFLWQWSGYDGSKRWFSSNSQPVLDSSNVMTGVVFSIVDVTESHEARQALERAHGRYSALVEHSSDVTCVLDVDGIVRYASPAYLAVYGESPSQRVGRPLFERVHPEDQAMARDLLALVLEKPDDLVTIEYRVVHEKGDVRYLEVTAANYLDDEAIGGIVINSHDVTERVVAADRLTRAAMYDPLTDLPNRSLLLDRLRQSITRAERTGIGVGLLYIDLDRFKRVNDCLGHLAGDELLKVVAHRLRDQLRPGDSIARLAGDEFVILVENIDDVRSTQEIAERVRQSIVQPVDIHGQSISADCSIGIAISDGSTADVLLQEADTALYRAKDRGRGRWEIYDQDMQLDAQRQMDTELVLRHALDSDRVVVHFQPIVALPSGRCVGSEALVRLIDENGRLVPPDDFIPVAEDSGLIIPLGFQVLRHACLQQAKWLTDQTGKLRVSVNLSARQLHTNDLVSVVKGVLDECGLPGSALCLELTETALIESTDSTQQTVRDLTGLGVIIALDDFGTGMSSLAHLRQFPISIVKIDRSFVDGLNRSKGDTEVVKAVIGLGQALGMEVVAEGVETETQARILGELGCSRAQGFLYGKPGPAHEMISAD
jgi:diguanylate cyclase (GGDEF)-like protein/PAS domain S-box-containing protein